MGKKILIVGGSAGGASCAARLRRLDEKAEIVLLERGEYVSYANCGLPYRVGGVIKSREALLVLTPDEMRRKYAVDVRTKNEAVAIDREKKTVRVKRLDTGETYYEAYDALVLATGSSPLRPPIPGVDSPRIRTLWTVPDAESIRALLREGNIKTAAVVGGGFIGLETAENLKLAGADVCVIEMLDQVMAPLDYDMAQLVHGELLKNGVRLYLGDGVTAFKDVGEDVEISLKSGTTLTADLVVMAVGVRPNGELARAAGLEVNRRGGVVTDANLRTSDPDIYAVGDVIEVEDYIFKDRTMIALAGPANKQGRIAANNICGIDDRYEGTQGTSVAKIFGLAVASTGVNERALVSRGFVKGRDYESIVIVQNSHARYYPGAAPMTFKLLFSSDGRRIYGAQIVGKEGVDKRIDVISTVIRLGGGAGDLKTLELAYAPPYSSAKDPVNMAGFVAENVIRGKARFADWDVVEKKPDALLLDVREKAELKAFALPGAVNIPLGELRERLDELDINREIVVVCAAGVRAYNAARILMNNGFEKVSVYPGGVRFYQATHCGGEEKR